MTVGFAGLRGTNEFSTEEYVDSYRELILRLNPNGSAPIFALTSRAKKEKVAAADFDWWEEKNVNVRLHVNASHADSVTTLTILANPGTGVEPYSDARDVNSGDILMNEVDADADYELMSVTSTSGSTAITVVRGISSTTAVALTTASRLLKIGSSHEEGSGAPTMSGHNPLIGNNYCQIHKTVFGVTGTLAATDTVRTGDPMDNDMARKLFRHSANIEYNILFGIKEKTTGGAGLALRRSGGIIEFLPTGNKIFKTGSPYADFNAFLDDLMPVFDWGGDEVSNERLFLLGSGALNNINKQIADRSDTYWTYAGTMEIFGMRFQRIETPQGTFAVKQHPLLSVNARFKNAGMVLNPSGLRWRYTKGRDTHKDFGPDGKGIQNNDEDMIKGQWFTEGGIELHHGLTHRWFQDIAFV